MEKNLNTQSNDMAGPELEPAHLRYHESAPVVVEPKFKKK